MKSLEHALEALIFASRWLLAPFFLGLIVAIGVLLIKFGKEMLVLVDAAMVGTSEDVILSILTLVDKALIASLLLIMVFSGYENFVSKMNIGKHEDRPAWMGQVGFADLKLKLIGAIVAISAVDLLKVYMSSAAMTSEQLMWKVVIHMTFVVSGALFAITDYIVETKKAEAKAAADP